MFTQTKINEDYLPEYNIKGLSDNLYIDFIEPILSGERTGDFLPDWDDTPSNFDSDTITRCDYDTYKLIKESKNKLTPENDCIAFQFDDYNNIESVDHDTKSGIAVRDTLNQVVNVLNASNNITTIGLSNRPLRYTKHKGFNGFMGWHTNSDAPGDRWYLVYNTDENSSFFRYIDPNTEEMITKWEPKGWSLNHFRLGDNNKPLWHCVYTKSDRFSFGIKDLGPILNEHEWKDVVVGRPTESEAKKLSLTEEAIQTLISGCEMGCGKGAYTLNEARILMNAIDFLNNSK
jgi:hypothetical protein|tara:strand:- start:355 stop:1221 length:867 start_codon:yes stop_codon:yes gene_type:complete